MVEAAEQDAGTAGRAPSAGRPVVFLGGSRTGVTAGHLPPEVRERVGTIVRKGMDVVIGDANGADRALQALLRDLGCERVTIYVGGAGRIRNRVDPSWPVRRIGEDSGLAGKELMTLKDEAMGEAATHGLMLWDDVYLNRFGNTSVSSGTLRNAWQLLGAGKPVALYHVPEGRFYDLGSRNAFERAVLPHCAPEAQRYWAEKLMAPLLKAKRRSGSDAQGSIPGL